MCTAHSAERWPAQQLRLLPQSVSPLSWTLLLKTSSSWVLPPVPYVDSSTQQDSGNHELWKEPLLDFLKVTLRCCERHKCFSIHCPIQLIPVVYREPMAAWLCGHTTLAGANGLKLIYGDHAKMPVWSFRWEASIGVRPQAKSDQEGPSSTLWNIQSALI